jgi:hypothetical protein
VRIRPISEQDFDAWQPCRKVIVHEHARRFGSVAPGGAEHSFALSWRSDGIAPVSAVGARSETWVGVDQRVACISDDGRIITSLGLSSSVLEIRCFGGAAVVLCETEALVFNEDQSIRATRSFTDIPSGLHEMSGKLVVTFDDGRTETLV